MGISSDVAKAFGKQPAPVEPAEVDDDLPEITGQQREFVRHLLDGKTASDAYRAAYNTENMQDSTLWACASRLKADRKVNAWLAAGYKAFLGTAIVTQQGQLKQYERLRELAIEQGDVKAAIKAEENRDKLAGLNVQRVDLTVHNPAALLAEINAMSPEIAQALAAKAGIPLPGPQGATQPIIEHEPSAIADTSDKALSDA